MSNFWPQKAIPIRLLAFHSLCFENFLLVQLFQNLKWELVDMGSLNGTLLNSRAVHHPDSGSRHWGDPIELSSGDIITLGTTSRIKVTRLLSCQALNIRCCFCVRMTIFTLNDSYITFLGYEVYSEQRVHITLLSA